MIDDKYTYKEVEREKTQLLLVNFIGEMVNQNQYTKYKMMKDNRILFPSEAKAIFEDKLAQLEDDKYQELVDKIMDIVIETI
jgi:hypothetical protein